ncbi:hypothetical protein D3D02_11260 [Halobellus sp. Atlit-38R]|uniref:hypothetical protein n=1 Tax=Halobellus sp. Atlit-38R TaxID=2282131 RepID=UPI000EF282A8|nr:hypothetical protein [Halobellus sp. Atlit-38R]RLM88573.1 hypothetical protein D3D02_11260 [Halobellus sp. Atlit-38R]
MADEQFHPSECCVKCPHFDEFGRACTHSLRQAIIKELTDGTSTNCPIYSEVRAQSMRDLEQQLVS